MTTLECDAGFSASKQLVVYLIILAQKNQCCVSTGLKE